MISIKSAQLVCNFFPNLNEKLRKKMAFVKLILDTRKNSMRKDGTFPVCLSVFHKKSRLVSLGYSTSIEGWDEKNSKLRKSSSANKNSNCDELNHEFSEKLYKAKSVISEIGSSIRLIDVNRLIVHIKSKWDYNPYSELRKKVENEISLSEWGSVLVKRKNSADKPATATYYANCIEAIKKFNGGCDIKLYDITVTFLKNFEAHHLGKKNSKNTIGIYLRGIRAIYNSAINEDQFIPIKNAFNYYRVPSKGRTKKRAVIKTKFLNIKELSYKPQSALWHAKNYALIMFYCRGMNFIDLVKIKVEDIEGNRLYYGRSKTDNNLSVAITEDLREILDYYLKDKKPSEYLFPNNYDGSTKHFEKYKTQRRRMNERLKIIAEDAGIEGSFTTYSIRHSWATIAKFMGFSTEIISQGLGHSSLRTTQIYLKDFENDVLDKANALIVA